MPDKSESERLWYCVENKQGSFNEDSGAAKFMDLFSQPQQLDLALEWLSGKNPGRKDL